MAATGKTINVATAAQLSAAIKSARGGEIILLAPGNYGALTIKGRMMTDTVTIKSADGSRDAVISDLRVNASSNFRFEDIDLHRPLAAGEADFTQAAYIASSSNIAIVGMDFTGSLDGNAANDGTALRFTGSQNVSVTGSTFEQWRYAGMFGDVTGLTLSGNTVKGAVKGFDFAGLQNALVSGNSFDGVKFDWTSAAFAGKNVVIRDNLVTTAAPVADVSGTGKIVNVATNAQLVAAIGAAKGGETILLAPGDYGSVSVRSRMMAETVTIKSADSAHDAVLSNLRIGNSAGFVFSDLDVHRTLAAGEGDWTPAVYVSGSQRIAFVGIDFTGSLDGNASNDGVGLRVSSSSAIKLIDSTFEQWTNAATFDHDTGLTIAGNSVTAVRDGFGFAAVHDVTIARNLFTGFTPDFAKSDHSDSIQFWNNGVNEGSSHVVIRDNAILQGANGGVHGIFIRAENLAFKHSDFTIENNLYNGDARHGITLAGTDGATIRGNTVTSAPGGMLEAGINLSNSSNVVIERNIAPLLLDNGNTSGLVWRDNVNLWDSKQLAGVSLASVFSGPATGGDIGAYALKAGGAAALAHAGFGAVGGIGAAAFDLSHLASYAGETPLAGLALFA